jgi:hypothetical protein
MDVPYCLASVRLPLSTGTPFVEAKHATSRRMKCAIGVGLVASALFLGCSDEREPIPDAGRPADAAARDTPAFVDRADVSIDVATTDGYIDLFDVFPLPDGGCPGCIRDRCGAQINGCINNPACAAGLFCTLQMCAGGLIGEGGFNPNGFACVLGCFNGDQNLAMMALGSLVCVTMTCGAACNFLDAGTDVRTAPDVQIPPDTSEDAPPGDAAPPDDTSADTTPDTGSGSDAAEDASRDNGSPDDDATVDGPSSDAGVDGGSAEDGPPDTNPPNDDGATE